VNVFVIGFSSSLALIVAIGAQNAFVLRQGLKREHVLPIVLVCLAADACLIASGVAGLGALVQRHPDALRVIRYCGAIFLISYAGLALRRALAASQMQVVAGGNELSLRAAIAATLGFTFLNPHVYLDTVVLLGAIGAQQPAALRPVFVAGGVAASMVWFTGLGFGARMLAPVFARPRAWRMLDSSIAVVMFTLAVTLVAGA
jgi:L-lysine exporter family protein LysE/ArgO